MGKVTATAEAIIGAPAEVVYDCLSDMRDHHPNILPDEFKNFMVVEGGLGAGTVTTFSVEAGGRTRDFRMTVAEPEPGRVLTETDANSNLVTTFTVTPNGENSHVRIRSGWDGAGGIGGIFECLFAPIAMRRIYIDELTRLDAYARKIDH